MCRQRQRWGGYGVDYEYVFIGREVMCSWGGSDGVGLELMRVASTAGGRRGCASVVVGRRWPKSGRKIGREEMEAIISFDESDDEDYTVICDENSFLYKIIYVNDLKTDSGNDEPLSPNPTVDYFDDLDCFKDFENEFPVFVYNDGLTSKSDLEIKPLASSECIDEFNLIDKASLSEYDEEVVSCFNDLFNDIHPDDLKSEKDNDDNNIGIIQSSEDNEITRGENRGQDMAPLPAADQRHPWLRYQIEEYTDGVSRRAASVRESCLEEIVRDSSTFGLRVYSGVSQHLMIPYSISGRGQAPEKGEEEQGQAVVTRELPLIDLHKLGRLNICTRYDDTWAWVTHGPKRQQAAMAGASEADEAGQATEEVSQEIPVPAPAQVHSPVLCHRGSKGLRRRCTTYGVTLWAYKEMS
ncbi:hypothetical protein Tco_1234882 [Tanacetum coccineum]